MPHRRTIHQAATHNANNKAKKVEGMDNSLKSSSSRAYLFQYSFSFSQRHQLLFLAVKINYEKQRYMHRTSVSWQEDHESESQAVVKDSIP